MELGIVFPWLREMFGVRNELIAEDYYAKRLREADAEALKEFIGKFPVSLKVRCAILAVGSSTFPKSFWSERRRLNKRYPQLMVNTQYEDVDLVVVPEHKTELGLLEQAVDIRLGEMGYGSVKREDTTLGVRVVHCVTSPVDMTRKMFEGWKEEAVGFCDFEYGRHSVRTRLRSGTGLDLILGRADIMLKTADEKIAEERNNNYHFSVLYMPPS